MKYHRHYTPVIGESKIPQDGDLLSPWSCEACYYEHPMKWINNELSGGLFLVCYRCDYFVIPTKKKKRVAATVHLNELSAPPPVKRA